MGTRIIVNELRLMSTQNIISMMLMSSASGMISIYLESIGELSKLTDGMIPDGESNVVMVMRYPIGIPIGLVLSSSEEMSLEIKSLRIYPISKSMWNKIDNREVENMDELLCN